MQANSATPRAKEYVAFLIFIAILGAFSSFVNDMYLPTIPDMEKS